MMSKLRPYNPIEMITTESLNWREKVSESLMNRYENAIGSNDGTFHRVMLNYQGDLSRFPKDIEVLSVIDGWVQSQIRMSQLPHLASLNEVLCVNLHAYPRTAC